MSIPRIAGALAVLLLVVLCVRLGLWQLDRAEQSERVAASVAERRDLPPLHLNGTGEPALAPFRQAIASGRYEPRWMVLVDRARDGRLGYEVFTPFRIDGMGSRVVVDRGWMPRGAAIRPPPAGNSTVKGLLVRPARPGLRLGVPAGTHRPWPYLDIPELAGRMKAELLPLVVIEDERMARRALEDGLARADKWGMHMGYAVQWFVFAALSIALFGFMLRTGRR